ncbi:MAG: 50S ribosomal protein L13 [Candidatus Liptonbacteria bacterium]|nr:50S ribosomal protein L13 [Candidatus Liptonbacteria bacterium]
MDYHLDAKNKNLGRLASEIALILQGKKSAHYEPRLVGSDKVLLENYKDFTLTGQKFKQKLYHRHTGYVGHIKTETFEQSFTKDPKRVIRETVRRMLPKNFLNQRRLHNLIFVD